MRSISMINILNCALLISNNSLFENMIDYKNLNFIQRFISL